MKKRAANGDGTLRLRKDGRWEYKVCIGHDLNQKPIRKSFYGKTKTEAKNGYKEYLVNSKDIKIESVKTLGEWAIVWLEVYKKGKVEFGTYQNYEQYTKNHIIPELGKLKFEQIKPAHIENLISKKASLSKSARQHIKIALNGIFETAIDNGFCTFNPCRKIKLKKDEKKEPQVFTVSEIENILKYAPQVEHGHIVELLLYTGMRIGEAVAVQWGDVDIKSGLITIRRSLAKKEGGGYKLKSTKSGKARTIGITSKLDELLLKMPRKGLFVLSESSTVPPSLNTIAKHYVSALEAINELLPDGRKIRLLTAHKCRHTYATYLLKGGANLREVQQLLGHSSVAVTEVYTHIDTDDIKSSVSKLPY